MLLNRNRLSHRWASGQVRTEENPLLVSKSRVRLAYSARYITEVTDDRMKVTSSPDLSTCSNHKSSLPSISRAPTRSEHLIWTAYMKGDKAPWMKWTRLLQWKLMADIQILHFRLNIQKPEVRTPQCLTQVHRYSPFHLFWLCSERWARTKCVSLFLVCFGAPGCCPQTQTHPLKWKNHPKTLKTPCETRTRPARLQSTMPVSLAVYVIPLPRALALCGQSCLHFS